jgi:beta-1,4-N-acetylglucosaminyltransferase
VRTFVAVGNATQRFPRLLDAVARLASELPQPVTVQFGNNPFTSDACRCVAFLDMDSFARQVANAEVLILHAGAGSIIHAMRAGKVPVVVPRLVRYGEHVDDHQLRFARALEPSGRVVVVEDVTDLASAVRAARDRQNEAWRPQPVPALVSMVKNVLDQYRDEAA